MSATTAKPVARKSATKVASGTRAGTVAARDVPARSVAQKPTPAVRATPRGPAQLSAAVSAIPAAKEINMADTIKTVTDKTQTVMTEAGDRAKASMEKGAQLFEDMNAFTKGNLEAMVESSKIAAKGAEEIAKYTADYARTTAEKANATLRQMASVKSPTELFQMQSEVAKQTMDAMAQEASKFTENYLKLMGQIAQPYQNRFAIAADKMKSAA